MQSSDQNSGFASYASQPERSAGRLHYEAEDVTRTAYQRDRDRIIHSAAFRRLEYKTQVFVNHEGDHYRTRLTHSLEVAQLARSMCRSLGLNEDLAEALSLAHDLGHTPFGHAGEDGLKEAMKSFGGFDHNAQTLRILTKLEHRYAEFDGLNLTWETLEGIAKHNGPVANPPRALVEYSQEQDLLLHTYPSLEAQLASLADDIAYNTHDIDDGIRSRLFTLEQISDVPVVGNAVLDVKMRYPHIDEYRLIHESIRRIVRAMVVDVLTETHIAIERENINTPDKVRNLGKPVVKFSESMLVNIRSLKEFLKIHMYRHYRVNRMTSKARRIVKELFAFFLNEPQCLPTEWQRQAGLAGSLETALTVADFIAGMTDRFAIDEYQRVFDMKERT